MKRVLFGKISGSLIRTITGHTDAVFGLALLPNGYLSSCSADMSIKFWYDFKMNNNVVQTCLSLMQ